MLFGPASLYTLYPMPWRMPCGPASLYTLYPIHWRMPSSPASLYTPQALSRSPEARRQILDARIKQDWDLTPQAWNSWWHDLALRCSLIEHPPAPDENDNSAL